MATDHAAVCVEVELERGDEVATVKGGVRRFVRPGDMDRGWNEDVVDGDERNGNFGTLFDEVQEDYDEDLTRGDLVHEGEGGA